MTNPVVTSPVVQAVGDAATAAAQVVSGWTVFDSIDPRQAFTPKSLMIGGTWDADVANFTSQDTVLVQSVETGAKPHVTETTTIQCVAYSGSGDWSFAQHRAAINAVLTEMRAQLRTIRSVDGFGASASMSAQQWAPLADENGTAAMALFMVTVRVLL